MTARMWMVISCMLYSFEQFNCMMNTPSRQTKFMRRYSTWRYIWWLDDLNFDEYPGKTTWLSNVAAQANSRKDQLLWPKSASSDTRYRSHDYAAIPLHRGTLPLRNAIVQSCVCEFDCLLDSWSRTIARSALGRGLGLWTTPESLLSGPRRGQ